MTGSHEVSGSIPLISTIVKRRCSGNRAAPFFVVRPLHGDRWCSDWGIGRKKHCKCGAKCGQKGNNLLSLPSEHGRRELRYRGMGCESPRRNGTVSVRPFRSSVKLCDRASVNHSGNRGRQETGAESAALLSQVRIFGSDHAAGFPGGVCVHKFACTGDSV